MDRHNLRPGVQDGHPKTARPSRSGPKVRPPEGPAARRSFQVLAGVACKGSKTRLPCQKGQKGRKGAQHHDNDLLSDLSDLFGSGALEKSNGLTSHRWMARPSVFVVTSF